MAAQAGLWMELKKGQDNPMLKAAQAISFSGEGEQTPEEKALNEMRGEVVAEDWRDDPRLKPKKEDRTELMQMADGSTMPRWLIEGDDAAPANENGSFEALLRGWAPSAHGQALDTSAIKEG